MKRSNTILSSLFVFFIPIVFVIISSCSKDDEAELPSNTAPVANAGDDYLYKLRAEIIPGFSTHLVGRGEDLEYNIKDYKWSKVSGPDSYSLESIDTVTARISELNSGIYQFELTITDDKGIYDKDTMMVAVELVSDDVVEINFEDQVWVNPWDYGNYYFLNVNGFTGRIPSGVPFNVFIQRDHDLSDHWQEVLPYNDTATSEYAYQVETRPGGGSIDNYLSLHIFYFGTDINDTPLVKIAY